MNAASWLDSLPPAHRWRELALVHGPRIATWTLALVLGVQGAVIVTNLTGGSKARKSGAAPAMRLSQSSRTVDIAVVTNGHLFGNAQSDTGSAQNAANAPQTNMPLVLTGVIAGDDPNTGFAILGENPGAAKVHAVGDTVPGGAKLHSVYSDRVVIDRSGILESLSLPRQVAASGVVQAAQPDPSLVDRVQHLITDQPGLLADIMRPQPVFADGKQRGYRVYPGKNRQAFLKLGLRPGDLVTGINGTPLDDPARGEEIFRTIGSSSEARVTVMRNGRQQDLTLNISQVAQEADQLGKPDGAPVAEPPPTIQPMPAALPETNEGTQ